MALRVALTGQLLVGTVQFSAAQDVEVPLPTGGPWKPSRYAVAGLPVTKALDTVQIVGAAAAEDYSVTIRGKTFTYTAGGAPTVTTIRDGLKALVDAGGLDITTADVGADSFSNESNVPGELLNTSVTADTPANIAASYSSSPAVLGVIGKESAKVTLRNPTAVTMDLGMVVAA